MIGSAAGTSIGRRRRLNATRSASQASDHPGRTV